MMTKEDIKKAFDICCSAQKSCNGCPLLGLEKQNGRKCKYNLFTSVIDLITDQEKEIEQLKAENKGSNVSKILRNNVIVEFHAKDWINRLAELEDKIMDGTLVELPCKVGDTVYEVFKEHKPPFIQETTIEKIVIVGEKGLRLRLARNSVYETAISSLGKTLFLTYEEAEAKLKELQEEKK